MQVTPPRRSRRPPPKGGASSFPLIPIVLGTIVIGFVIGAGLSIAGKHGTEPVAVVSAGPTAEPTVPPATLAPTERPTREPTMEPATESPTLAPTHRPPATRAPAAAPAASAAPAVRAAPPAPPSPVPSAASAAGAPAEPRPVARPANATSSSANVATAASGAPPAADDTDSDFGRLAASLVRGYLAAVARGDSAGAASSLASSSDSVTEAGIVDGSMRIRHVEARAVGDAATVNVDFDTSNGAYSGQYTVRRTPAGAAVIVAHSILKP